MEKIFGLIVVFSSFVAQFVLCDPKVEVKSGQNIGKFEPTVLSKTLADHVGQLLAVEFNFRGKEIRHIKPNWFQSSVWQRDPTAKKGFSNVPVLFAKKDVATFESITTDATSRARLILYGRVERDADSQFYFVHVLGRRATIDSSGNASVAW